MGKLVYVTDTHGKGSNPKSRKDDFAETILNKVKWICDFAKEIEADAIIHGGDWLETPDVSNNFIQKMMKIVSESIVLWFGVLGNHDVYGQNNETFYKTPLCIADVCGAFTRLGGEPITISNFSITGVDYNDDIDKGDKKYYTDSNISGKEGVLNVHIVHGMLDDHKWMNGIACTTIDEIADKCNADVVLTGHIHSGYGIVKTEKTTFINPNALARTTSSIGDISNTVQVAVIEFENGKLDTYLVPLPSDIARPGEEVLDRERILLEKENKKKLTDFAMSLSAEADMKIDRVFDVYRTLNSIAQENDLPPELISIVSDLLRESEEELRLEEGE